MTGFNLVLALFGAFMMGAGFVAYLWWACVPLQRNEVNPFGVLSDPPRRDADYLLTPEERTPEGMEKARERAARFEAMKAKRQNHKGE